MIAWPDPDLPSCRGPIFGGECGRGFRCQKYDGKPERVSG